MRPDDIRPGALIEIETDHLLDPYHLYRIPEGYPGPVLEPDGRLAFWAALVTTSCPHSPNPMIVHPDKIRPAP